MKDLHEELEKWEKVKYRMREEGIEYCFRHYSSFDNIKDTDFHVLRQLLLNTMKAIEDRVNFKISELETQIEEIEEDDSI